MWGSRLKSIITDQVLRLTYLECGREPESSNFIPLKPFKREVSFKCLMESVKRPSHMLHSYTVRRVSRNTAEVLGVISMTSGKVVGRYLVFDYNCAR